MMKAQGEHAEKKVPPDTEGEIVENYTNNHSEAKVRGAKKCICRNGRHVAWEAQYQYNLEVDKVPPEERMRAYAHMKATRVFKRYLGPLGKTGEWIRVEHDELFFLWAGGIGGPDPHWEQEEFPRFCAIKGSTHFEVTLAYVYPKMGPKEDLDVFIPLRKPWYASNRDDDKKPESDSEWKLMNPDSQYPNSPSGVPWKDMVDVSDSEESITDEFRFSTLHCFLGWMFVLSLQPDIVNKGKKGTPTPPEDIQVFPSSSGSLLPPVDDEQEPRLMAVGTERPSLQPVVGSYLQAGGLASLRTIQLGEGHIVDAADNDTGLRPSGVGKPTKTH